MLICLSEMACAHGHMPFSPGIILRMRMAHLYACMHVSTHASFLACVHARMHAGNSAALFNKGKSPLPALLPSTYDASFTS